MIYISNEQAEHTHRKTIEFSGGGVLSVLNIGYLFSASLYSSSRLSSSILFSPRNLSKSTWGTELIYSSRFLCSALELIQNDDYYPTFEDKLVHLIWSINRNHAYSDGNKRLSITLGVQFLSLNGYLFCIERFLHEMENISYHLAAEHIEKELLTEIIHSFLENEDDFSEELKLKLLLAIDDQKIGFNENN